MENQRILVIGGTGYIGRELVDTLSKKNKVFVLTREKRNKAPSVKNVQYCSGDVTDHSFLSSFLKDFDVVVYLAAIVRTFNKSSYGDNSIGVRNTIDAMKLNSLKKILYFSTQNVFIKKTGPYGKSKKVCEKIIEQSGLDYTIVRPNYVYGIDKENDFFRLAQIMKRFRICPIIGNGKNRIQPINKVDVVHHTVWTLNHWVSKKVVNFSGNRTISLSQVANMLRKELKIKVLTLNIPLFLLKIFHRFVPFDVEGYSSDRVVPENSNKMIGNSNFENDLKNIIQL
jgi:nucleoside-diphosphate-sugar epimerase